MPAHDTSREEMWRAMLTSRNPYLRKRRIYGRIPSAPRCKLCAAPFGLPGSLVMSRLGHPRWVKNPKYCAGCFSMIRANHGGAEVECSLLFADIRGSVTLAEQMRPTDFNRLMGRFYDTATQVLVAQALLRKTGHDARRGPWVPVGAGVNTGIAYVGSVGEGFDAELTALGDTVNTTARLASAAGQGEILVTAAAAASAGLTGDGLERRSLTLKGKSEPTDVLILRVGPH